MYVKGLLLLDAAFEDIPEDLARQVWVLGVLLVSFRIDLLELQYCWDLQGKCSRSEPYLG
jgi:hypothetical protein